MLAASTAMIAPCAAEAPLPGPHAPAGQTGHKTRAPALPSQVSALSWVVADAATGDVLASKDAHRHLPPASTLKTLFALTVLPKLSGQGLHTVSHEDLAGMGEGSSRVGLVEGRAYRVPDLWRGVFLSSGGDAVHVLAAMNGGWQKTTDEMRKRAVELGAHDTQVMSPDGYDTPGQYSSAYDLAVFGRAGLSDPAFARYCSTSVAQFPGGLDKDGRSGPSFEIQNTNRLLAGTQDVSPYPGLIGVKNGYTTDAGNTLVAAARHGDRTLIVTVMNPQEGSVYEDARALLDWGFAADGAVRPVGTLQPAAAKTTSDAKGAQAPPAAAAAAAGHHTTTKKFSVLAGVAAVGALLASLACSLWLLRRRMRR